MVLYLKLAIQMKGWIMMLMDDSTQGVTWWLEMVKIARKGFEVVSNGEGQAMALQPKNLARVKKKVLAFSWGINQAIIITLKWGIKYIGYIVGSDLIHLRLTHIYWMESSHMLKMTVLKKKIKDWHVDTLTWWRLRAVAFDFEENQIKRFKFLFHLILSK